MIIGLAGPPEAGKNACADILSLLYGYRQVSYAQALRMEVSDILHERTPIPLSIRTEPIHAELLDLLRSLRGADPWKKPTPQPMRRALQLYGTDFRRAENNDYWVDKVTPIADHSALTDVRFWNEGRPVTELWYIYRPEAEMKVAQYAHASEGNILPQHCHRVIFNDSTLEDLEKQVSGIFG